MEQIDKNNKKENGSDLKDHMTEEEVIELEARLTTVEIPDLPNALEKSTNILQKIQDDPKVK